MPALRIHPPLTPSPRAKAIRERLRALEAADHDTPVRMWAALLRKAEDEGAPPDLVDSKLQDTYHDLPRPPHPALRIVTKDSKVALLQARDTRGYSLWHPHDGDIEDESLQRARVSITARPYLQTGHVASEEDARDEDDIPPDDAQHLDALTAWVCDALHRQNNPDHPDEPPTRLDRAERALRVHQRLAQRSHSR